MLEVLTMQYGNLPGPTLFALSFGLIVLGGLAAGLVLPAPAEPLSRSWYYLRFAQASFVLAAGQLLWLLYVPALKMGLSFAFLVADTVTCLAFGAYSAQIARARSQDGYGHGGRAWMGFVPLANLVLLFRRPLTPGLARASAGAAWAGLALMVAANGVTRIVEASGDSIAAQFEADPEARAIAQSLTFRALGIETALDQLVTAEAAPRSIEPGLTLAAVARQGAAITYDFMLDEPGATSLDPAYHRQTQSALCSALMPYLQAGATGLVRYARPDGLEIARLNLTVKDCTT